MKRNARTGNGDKPTKAAAAWSKPMFLMALGAGCYWGATVFNFISGTTIMGMNTDASSQIAQLSITVLLVAVMLLCSRLLVRRPGQLVLSAIALLTGVSYIAVLLVSQPVANGATEFVLLLLQSTSGTLLMFFWGLAFATLDRRKAEQAVTVAVLISWVVCFLLLTLPAALVTVIIAQLLKAASVVPFMYGGFRMPVVERTVRQDAHREMLGFYMSRLVIGLALGVVSYLAFLSPSTAAPLGWGWFVVIACISLTAVVRLVRGGRVNMPLLGISPLVLAALLLVCHQPLSVSFGASGCIALGIIWFSWIALSSTQISEFKEEFGLDEVRLSFTEKATISVFWFVGSLLAFSFSHGIMGESMFSSFVAGFPMVAALVVVIIAVYSFISLSNVKEREKVVDSALAVPEKQLVSICDAIAADHALTPRETEILVLVAKGHTRSYICEQLVLSPGTVKSHITHIHQKLGVHDREAVFKMLDDYRKDMSISERFEETDGA